MWVTVSKKDGKFSPEDIEILKASDQAKNHYLAFLAKHGYNAGPLSWPFERWANEKFYDTYKFKKK